MLSDLAGPSELAGSLAFQAYLCLADVCGMLTSNYHYFGSASPYPDVSLFSDSLTELFGADIDRVFVSQYVADSSGKDPDKKHWAFTSTDDRSGFLGARLYYSRSLDLYFLSHPPTRPDNAIDNATNETVINNLGIPEKFAQAATLMSLIKPEYRDKFVLTGHSLGGGLAAYAALQTAISSAGNWIPRTIAFDPLGLNQLMMAEAQSGLLTELSQKVDWNYIEGSWVAALNVEHGLSSVGTVHALPQDPVRVAAGLDPHDLENVRYGLTSSYDFVSGDH